MPTILLIRHAQASYGAADYDVLSPLAGPQIAALDAALVRRGVAPARVVSGPRRRQRETAARGGDGAAIQVDPRFDEYPSDAVLAADGHGDVRLEGPRDPAQPALSSQAFQEVLDRALLAWVAGGATGDAVTSWASYLGAALAATQDVAGSLGRGETALVFTSAGTIAAICAALLGVPETAFVPLNRVQVNTGISKLAVGRSGTTLVSFNDHSHLDDVDPALVTYR